MTFSTPKKQRVCGRYSKQLLELVRASLNSSEERINQLTKEYEKEKIKISDIDILLGVARDFVAVFDQMPESLRTYATSFPSKFNQEFLPVPE